MNFIEHHLAECARIVASPDRRFILEENVRPNLAEALKFGKQVSKKVMRIVRRKGYDTAHRAGACFITTNVKAADVTPRTKAFRAVIWHLLLPHSELKVVPTKRERVAAVK